MVVLNANASTPKRSCVHIGSGVVKEEAGGSACASLSSFHISLRAAMSRRLPLLE
jgi:hypothetical protein